MFAKRYSPDELIDIIAAPSYSPEIINYVKKVSSEPFLSQFLSQKPKLGITGTIAKDYVEGDTKGAVPYVSTKQVKGLHAYIDDAKYISKEADIEWAKCRVEDGDIIINKSGNVGAAAVLCCAPYAYANSVSDIINIKLAKSSEIDRDYLVVYLNSPYGQKQLQRLSGGAIFSHVSLHAIPDIRIFHPDIKAQKYIGDKVRQAEQLRAWAKQVVTSLRREFENLYRPISHYDSFKRMSYPIRPDQLFEVLTPASYPPHIEKYFEENPNVTLGEICSQIYIGKTLASVESREGVKQATSRSCSGLFLKQPMNLVERKGNVDPLAKKDILLTNAAHDKNYIGKDVSFNHSDELILPSTKVLVIRLKECGIPASYVHAYLMTEAGYTQWQAIVRGISAGIHPSDVARIRIPVPDNRAQLETMAVKADDLYIQAGLAQEVSRLLTIAAKNLVEALIEGQLTEQQLIQAQQALEDGDNSLDQAILSKLSNQGYAIEGATPLFSDIDELYRLLESAAQTEAEE
ncbi:restriction endonuclease subunit S [Halopseudomonas formosensis]|uniref:Type I restriction modification DNA specificity domain-containing protein n=1 Tax=Halopseudomonas formosensis TaxID=1002526 RepID=A0ABU5C0Z3_9GAMM|nr:restriction endonuclease subunit S [Halopseudomonas formosensis]MDX9688704.1 hypothetical protein [Halopseudomonas formosensis]